MNRNDRLIKKKIYKYMLTGIMTTVALQLGNIVDAMIVGNLIGSIGNGAVSASTPYTYVLQAAAILLASGGAVIAAVMLGKRQPESAGKVMGFCLLAGVLYPLAFAVLSPVAVPLYAQFTGAEGEIKDLIYDFTMVYSLGIPVISFVLIMSYFMNVDNHPAYSAAMNITANVVNLVLDFILVKFTPLGMKGAALSTALGYLVAGCIFIPLYLRSSRRMLKPSLKALGKAKQLITAALKRGSPNLIYLIMTVIGMSIINRSVLNSLGSGYYSAYAVTNNTQAIVTMFLNGIASVIASVAGVLYGEKDFYGMRAVLKKVLKTTLIAGGAIMVLFLAFPQALAAMYGFKNPDILPELKTGMRIFSLSFGFFILNSITQNYYRTIGQTFLSITVTVLELLVIKIPLMLAGLKWFGFSGLFTAIIFSELLSFLIVNLIRIAMQKKGKVPQKGFMAIPERREGEICDLSITAGDDKAARIYKEIIGYCLKEGMPERDAKIMGMAVEELVLNIGLYGYPDKDKKDIDICLSKNDGKFYLRLRDDGIPFDPVSYEPQGRDEDDIGGLDLLKKMAVKLSYMRVINLNNTIIEIDCAKGAEVNG